MFCFSYAQCYLRHLHGIVFLLFLFLNTLKEIIKMITIKNQPLHDILTKQSTSCKTCSQHPQICTSRGPKTESASASISCWSPRSPTLPKSSQKNQIENVNPGHAWGGLGFSNKLIDRKIERFQWSHSTDFLGDPFSEMIVWQIQWLQGYQARHFFWDFPWQIIARKVYASYNIQNAAISYRVSFRHKQCIIIKVMSTYWYASTEHIVRKIQDS